MKTPHIAILAIALATMAFCSCTSILGNKDIMKSVPKEVQEWEMLAADGDTAALHRLIYFYDENCSELTEVEEVITEDGEDITEEAIIEQGDFDEDLNQYYLQKLYYWLQKGISVKDPVAAYIMGKRLYYTDQKAAIKYLAPAALMGNSRAALLCGSALYNLGKGDAAINFLILADEMGEPSAGWHLALCYAGNAGVEQDLDKAMQYLVKSGMNDDPDAVLELKRVDPQNPIWQRKADSLDLEIQYMQIIPIDN